MKEDFPKSSLEKIDDGSDVSRGRAKNIKKPKHPPDDSEPQKKKPKKKKCAETETEEVKKIKPDECCSIEEPLTSTFVANQPALEAETKFSASDVKDQEFASRKKIDEYLKPPQPREHLQEQKLSPSGAFQDAFLKSLIPSVRQNNLESHLVNLKNIDNSTFLVKQQEDRQKFETLKLEPRDQQEVMKLEESATGSLSSPSHSSAYVDTLSYMRSEGVAGNGSTESKPHFSMGSIPQAASVQDHFRKTLDARTLYLQETRPSKPFFATEMFPQFSQCKQGEPKSRTEFNTRDRSQLLQGAIGSIGQKVESFGSMQMGIQTKVVSNSVAQNSGVFSNCVYESLSSHKSMIPDQARNVEPVKQGFPSQALGQNQKVKAVIMGHAPVHLKLPSANYGISATANQFGGLPRAQNHTGQAGNFYYDILKSSDTTSPRAPGGHPGQIAARPQFQMVDKESPSGSNITHNVQESLNSTLSTQQLPKQVLPTALTAASVFQRTQNLSQPTASSFIYSDSGLRHQQNKVAVQLPAKELPHKTNENIQNQELFTKTVNQTVVPASVLQGTPLTAQLGLNGQQFIIAGNMQGTGQPSNFITAVQQQKPLNASMFSLLSHPALNRPLLSVTSQQTSPQASSHAPFQVGAPQRCTKTIPITVLNATPQIRKPQVGSLLLSQFHGQPNQQTQNARIVYNNLQTNAVRGQLTVQQGTSGFVLQQPQGHIILPRSQHQTISMPSNSAQSFSQIHQAPNPVQSFAQIHQPAHSTYTPASLSHSTVSCTLASTGLSSHKLESGPNLSFTICQAPTDAPVSFSRLQQPPHVAPIISASAASLSLSSSATISTLAKKMGSNNGSSVAAGNIVGGNIMEGRVREILAQARREQLQQQGVVKQKPTKSVRKNVVKNISVPVTTSVITTANTSFAVPVHQSPLLMSNPIGSSVMSSSGGQSSSVCVAETLIQMAKTVFTCAGSHIHQQGNTSNTAWCYNPSVVKLTSDLLCKPIVSHSAGKTVTPTNTFVPLHVNISSSYERDIMPVLTPHTAGQSVGAEPGSLSYTQSQSTADQEKPCMVMSSSKLTSVSELTPKKLDSSNQMSVCPTALSGHGSRPPSLSPAPNDQIPVLAPFNISFSCQSLKEPDSALPPSLTACESYSPLLSSSCHDMFRSSESQLNHAVSELPQMCPGTNPSDSQKPSSSENDMSAAQSVSSSSTSRTEIIEVNTNDTASLPCPKLSPHIEEHQYAAANQSSSQNNKLCKTKPQMSAARRVKTVTVETNEESSNPSMNLEMPDLSPQVRTWPEDFSVCNVAATTTISYSQTCQQCQMSNSPSPPFLQPFHHCVASSPWYLLPKSTISCPCATSPISVSSTSTNCARPNNIGPHRNKTSQTLIASTESKAGKPGSESIDLETRMGLSDMSESPPLLTLQDSTCLVAERNTPPLLGLAQEALCSIPSTSHTSQLEVIGELSVSTGKQV